MEPVTSQVCVCVRARVSETGSYYIVPQAGLYSQVGLTPNPLALAFSVLGLQAHTTTAVWLLNFCLCKVKPNAQLLSTSVLMHVYVCSYCVYVRVYGLQVSGCG